MSSNERPRYDESGAQNREDMHYGTFDPNLYAKYSTGPYIMKSRCLRRQSFPLPPPKYYFQADTLHCQWFLLASLVLIYLAVLTPRVRCSVRHILSPKPTGSLIRFPSTATNSTRFCQNDRSHWLGLLAPGQRERKQTFTLPRLKLLHARETAELTR